MKSDSVIIISNYLDWTTYKVIDWLIANKTTVYYQGNIDYYKNKISFRVKNNGKDAKLIIDSITYNDNTKIWLRKSPLFHSLRLDGINNNNISEFIKDEKESFFRFYTSFLNNNFWSIGRNSQYNTPFQVSKLECLFNAQKCNLNIPNSLISNDKQEIENFISSFVKVIIKPLSEPVLYSNNNQIFITHTKIFEKSWLFNFSENFFPIYLQEYIEKEIEIRVFILDNSIYSIAIFSQNDPTTKVDFRRYNTKLPNRVVPFKLPNTMESKLLKLVKLLGLNTCSIDLIYTPQKKFYFLEVNPVGQFGSLSYNCNLYLEEKIAQSLA